MKNIIFILLLFVANQATSQEIFEITSIGDAIVGNEITIEVNAKHPEPINRISFIRDNDVSNQIIHDCDESLDCKLTTTFTLPYEGTVKFRAFLWTGPFTAIKEASLELTFVCGEEYCQPDPIVSEFMTWMRVTGYSECVTEKYYSFLKDSNLRSHMKDFINSNGHKLEKTMNLNFYDIIPTDNNAVYYEMNTANAIPCQPSSNWPDFCQNSEPADYKMVEKHFKKTFGINLNLTYNRIEINYSDEFGELTFNPNIGWEFSFIQLNSFENNFPRNSIVHYSLDSLDGLKIGDQSKGTFVTRMWRNVKYFRDLEVYAHEFGHSFGLPHGFVNGTNPEVLFTLDGIMSNSYITSTKMYDPLDPLERFALQPVDGYVDQLEFADAYNQGIVETYHIDNKCEEPDLSLIAFDLISKNDDKHVFRIECGNIGDLNCGFVELSVNAGDINGDLIESRIIENLDLTSNAEITFTIDNSLLTSDNIYATLDLGEQIVEIDENNNSKAFLLTSINEASKEQSLLIYPNPNNGIFKLKNVSDKHIFVSVIDLIGSVEYQGRYEEQIDLSHLENGIYYLQYQDAKSKIMEYKRIIIAK